MTEAGIQVGLARIRSGATKPPPTATEATVRAALSTVMDPELPMVSIVDLGMVGSVGVGATIRVELLPTFVGCPALELIRTEVTARLAAFDCAMEVVTTFSPPWTPERITAAGRAALAAAGIAPPAELADMRCPLCDSDRVVMDNAFGPTQCRSLFYCRECRQPFEAIKPV